MHVFNKNTNAATITNNSGYFEIGVRQQDTLFFSAIQYKNQYIIITKEIYNTGTVSVKLSEQITALKEVVVTPYNLSGDLKKDMENANIQRPINFYDVNIPGFKGKPEEKIVTTLQALNYGIPTHVNLEALYKNLSGYYDNLRTRRKWDKENEAIIKMINYYGLSLFTKTYGLHEENVYPFVLNCVASTQIENDFNAQNHNLVLRVFEEKLSAFKAEIKN